MSDLALRRREYLSYLHTKREEINEQRNARHYLHGDQWTESELKTLKKRKQAPTTYNMFALRVNGIVGLLEKTKQDPKAYPRTPKQDDGAELATAALRYAMDVNKWDMLSSSCGRDAATTGIAGVEIEIVQGDIGDPDVGLNEVDSDLFFYDPSSYREDFSDARFMGVAKWVRKDLAKEMFPEQAEEIENAFERFTGVVGADADRERKWVDATNDRIRLVDHWYVENGAWKWCIYSGDVEISSGDAFLKDEKGKTLPKYIMFSANVDHDGDRYGFFRNIKSLQDEVNQRRSKALWLSNARRMIIEEGAADVEKVRMEASRPDGVIVVQPNMRLEFEDAKSQADMKAQLEFAIKAENDLEQFGPNPALVGQDDKASSGRAISLLQQAGLAQIGPFIISYREWKERVYKSVWNAVQQYWQQERWIRVTDDEGIAQFIQINGVDLDQYGRPAIVNAIGSLDVDIIIDEGPNMINMQADSFDTLMALAPAVGPGGLPVEMLVELSPLPSSQKKKFLDMIQQRQQIAAQKPDPEEMKAQAQLKAKQAESAMMFDAKQREADLGFASKQREAELNLRVKEMEANIELQKLKTQSDMATQAERNKSAQAAGFGQEENDGSDVEGKPTIADMLQHQSEVMSAAIAAMAQAVSAAAGPKEISVIRDASGAIVGGKSEPMQAAH